MYVKVPPPTGSCRQRARMPRGRQRQALADLLGKMVEWVLGVRSAQLRAYDDRA